MGFGITLAAAKASSDFWRVKAFFFSSRETAILTQAREEGLGNCLEGEEEDDDDDDGLAVTVSPTTPIPLAAEAIVGPVSAAPSAGQKQQ